MTLKWLSKKTSIYIALISILAGLILVKINGREDPKPHPISMPAVNPFQDAIAASGIIEALDRNIAIGTPVSGLVTKVNVIVGQFVNKGDILFEIDDRELQAQLLVQKANIVVSEATVQRLEDQLGRLKSIEDPRAVSVDEVKTKQNDVAVAAAQLKAAEALAQETDLLIDRLYVKSPKDGIILQSNIRQGEFLSINTSTPPILLGDLSRLQVRADIDEQNASRFDPNERAYAFPKNNTILKIPLIFDRIEPYVVPKRSLTGNSEERVDTRVLQVIYSFEEPKNFHVYVGQQVDVFIETKRTAFMKSFFYYTRGLFFLLGILLPSCRPLPPYQPPTIPVSNHWKELSENSEEISSNSVPFEKWWQVFNDPTLNELEELSLANNPTLKVALWRISQAWAETQTAISFLYPNLAFVPSTLNQLQLIRIPGYNTTNLNPLTPPIDPYQRFQTRQYNLPFMASYEFDLWGRLRYGVDQAYATAEAQESAWLAARLSLTSSVASTYLTIRTYDAQEKVLIDTIHSRQDAFDINQIRYNAGLINYADVSRAETQLWIAKADLSETRELRSEKEHLLAVLVGEIPANFSEKYNPINGDPPVIAAILPSEVILRRPDLAQAEREIAASYANEGITVASLFPSLSIDTEIGFNAPTAAKILNWKARFFSLAWSGFQTIYDAGRKVADVTSARAQFEQTVYQYADKVLQAFKEVEDALSKLKWQNESLQELSKALNSAEISKALASERYQKGLVSYLEVVDAERTRLETELRTVQTIGDRFTSTVEFIKAIGGSWNLPLDFYENSLKGAIEDSIDDSIEE